MISLFLLLWSICIYADVYTYTYIYVCVAFFLLKAIYVCEREKSSHVYSSISLIRFSSLFDNTKRIFNLLFFLSLSNEKWSKHTHRLKRRSEDALVGNAESNQDLHFPMKRRSRQRNYHMSKIVFRYWSWIVDKISKVLSFNDNDIKV